MGLIVAIVAVIAVVVAGIFFLTRDDDDDDDTASDDTTQQTDDDSDGTDDTDVDDTDDSDDGIDTGGAGRPSQPPSGEPEFDDLADDCYEGEMQACDELFNVTAAGSEYEEYGDTCGGRWPVSARPSCTAVITNPLPPND